MKTKYISIEGGDGSGKTTLVQNLIKYLENQKIKFLLTKEFGSDLDPACSELRKIALNSTFQLDDLAAQLVFAAIVRQHQSKVIIPAIEQKKYDIILSDRGIDSNFAYGPAHGINKKSIETIFKIAYDKAVLPDITIYLDVDPLLAAYRRTKRVSEKFSNNGVDRVEQKGISLQKEVRKNFLNLAKKNEKRIFVVEVTESKKPEDILNEVCKILNKNNVI